MFILKWVLLLPVRIIAFILSLVLTIIRVVLDTVAKMTSIAAGSLLFFIVGCLIYSLVRQSWSDSLLLAIIASVIIAVYFVAGFIAAEIDELASILMEFVRS